MKKLRVAFLALAVLALCVSSAFALSTDVTVTFADSGSEDIYTATEYDNYVVTLVVSLDEDELEGYEESGDIVVNIVFNDPLDGVSGDVPCMLSELVSGDDGFTITAAGYIPELSLGDSEDIADLILSYDVTLSYSEDIVVSADYNCSIEVAKFDTKVENGEIIDSADVLSAYVSAEQYVTSPDYEATVTASPDYAMDLDARPAFLPDWLGATASGGTTTIVFSADEAPVVGTEGTVLVPFASTDTKVFYALGFVVFSGDAEAADKTSGDVVTSLDLSADVTTVSVKVGETKTVTLTAVSNDYEISGDVVISVDSIPSGITVEASGDAGSFDATYAITGVTAGSYTVTFTVKDDVESGDLSISVTVQSGGVSPDVAPTLTTEMTADELSAIKTAIAALVPGGSTSFDVKFSQPLSTWYGYWKLGSGSYNQSGSANASSAAAFYTAADTWFTITPSESDPTHTAHFDLVVPEDVDAGTYTVAAGGIIGSGWANLDEIGKEATPYDLGTFTVSSDEQTIGSSSGGCDAGFGALALALLAAPLFLRRRS